MDDGDRKKGFFLNATKTENSTIRIILPFPPRSLSPNARVHWARKSQDTKRYRQAAYFACCAAGGLNLRWPAATARLTLYWPDHRRRDIGNAEASMKAAFDGIVDSGLIPDDCYPILQHEQTRVDFDAKEPRVEIEIARREQQGV